MRKCTRCGEMKPESEYSPDKRRRQNGKQAMCKPCKAAWARDYAARCGEKYHRRSNLWRTHKMTLEQFANLLDAQLGVCAVCAGPPCGKGNYHVDHDHITGKVRGLLCHKCNVALGMVQDSVEHLNELIEYLEKAKSAECLIKSAEAT